MCGYVYVCVVMCMWVVMCMCGCVCVFLLDMQGLVRNLSLWDWRHWQNQPLYTHRVEHSLRCLSFISIMDLIDRMKLGEEVRRKRN